ncbi:MAG TPA: hypothetical protein VFD32_22200 [Dehalococcoidia bacterium]|nr:hypothetical protein [Dehalococcoidia bacterium]
MLRVLVALAVACSVAASAGGAARQTHVYTPGSSSTTCPGRFPIKVSKEGIVYGPWLRGRYGSIAAVGCYDSVADAVKAGAQDVERNK